MTPKEDRILEYLKTRDTWVGPTEIGQHFKRPYSTASAWCNQPLKSLLEQGLVERNPRGKYRTVTPPTPPITLTDYSDMIYTVIMTRVGEEVTAELARESANNIAQALQEYLR